MKLVQAMARMAPVVMIVAVACQPRQPSSDEHPAVGEARRLTATAQVLVAAARVVCGGDAKCLAGADSADTVIAGAHGALQAYDACKDDPQSGECIAAALDEVHAFLPRLRGVVTSRQNACIAPAASAAP